MLSCEEALEQMSQALDGPLTGEERGELEAHLAGCPACRTDWAALRELHQAMGELEETPAPEGFADLVMERVREESAPAKVVPLWRRPQWRAAAGLAACAVICVGLYYGADRSGAGTAGSLAAVPDPAPVVRGVRGLRRGPCGRRGLRGRFGRGAGAEQDDRTAGNSGWDGDCRCAAERRGQWRGSVEGCRRAARLSCPGGKRGGRGP